MKKKNKAIFKRLACVLGACAFALVGCLPFIPMTKKASAEGGNGYLGIGGSENYYISAGGGVCYHWGNNTNVKSNTIPVCLYTSNASNYQRVVYDNTTIRYRDHIYNVGVGNMDLYEYNSTTGTFASGLYYSAPFIYLFESYNVLLESSRLSYFADFFGSFGLNNLDNTDSPIFSPDGSYVRIFENYTFMMPDGSFLSGSNHFVPTITNNEFSYKAFSNIGLEVKPMFKDSNNRDWYYLTYYSFVVEPWTVQDSNTVLGQGLLTSSDSLRNSISASFRSGLYSYSVYESVYREFMSSGLYYKNEYNSIEQVGVILRTTIEGVFNLEVFPGFKLYMFLLIGLGCIGFGLALKILM